MLYEIQIKPRSVYILSFYFCPYALVQNKNGTEGSIYPFSSLWLQFQVNPFCTVQHPI